MDLSNCFVTKPRPIYSRLPSVSAKQDRAQTIGLMLLMGSKKG